MGVGGGACLSPTQRHSNTSKVAGPWGVAQGGRGSRPTGEPVVGETGLENRPTPGSGRDPEALVQPGGRRAKVGHSDGLRSGPYSRIRGRSGKRTLLLSPKPQNQSL